jgi:hypothetical protein
MVKNIKKSFKYLIIIAGIIIALPTIIFLLLSIPKVQTLLVERMTNHFSAKFSSSISVGKIEYTFFNRLNLNDILIKDRNDDTLIYSQNAKIGIKKLDLRNKTVTLGHVTLDNPVVAFITDSTGEMNLLWYLNLMKNPGDTLKKIKSTIKINQVNINNARFSLINKTKKGSKIPTDFNDLRLSGINGSMEEFLIHNDTTSFNIYNLGFRESKGFTVRRMNSEVVLTKNNILFNSASINCDSSILNINHVKIVGDSASSFRNFTKKVRLDIALSKSLVNLSDLKYFVPVVKDMNESVWFSGKVFGTVSELRGRNINLSYSDNTQLDCDFDFSGLPDIENSFIYIGINNLVTNAKDIEKIKIPGKNAIRIPELLYKLGTVTFNGSFTGFTTDFVTYGKLITSEGTISTDISLRPQEKNKFQIKGLIKGSNIALGQLTGKPEIFGNLSMETNVDGYAYSLKKFNGNLTGLIDSIEINNYKYRNISLNGIFSENTWDGNIKISEDNIKMDLLGMFNFSSELPEFDFTLNLAHADLHRLNFDKSDTSSSLSVLLTANFKGNSIDNLDGEIKLLNSNLRKYGNTLDSYDFSIKTFTENDKPAISLRTDYVDADLRGYYNFAGIGTIFKSALSSMMPSRFSAPEPQQGIINNFNFNVNFKNTDKITNFFHTGIQLAEKSIINGEILGDSIIKVRGDAKILTIKGNTFKDLSVDASFLSPNLIVKVKSSSLNLLGQSELMGFTIDLNTQPDNFILTTDWDNKGTNLNRGTFVATGTFIKSDNEKANPFLKITIDSTGIYNRNNLWQISRSGIVLDSNSVSINKLYISNKERYYLVHGTLSEDPGDTLHLEFKGIDISPLNYLINKNKKPDKISLSLKGFLNGQVLLTNLYKNPLIESNLKINSLSLLQSNYGDLSIVSEWNNEKKVADIHAENNLDNKKMLEISGNYDPAIKKIDLTAKAENLPIDALNPLLKIFASGISGTATGKVNLSGEFNKLVLKGALMAENAFMKIDYLQTKYKINDSIRFDKNAIIFKNLKVTDEKGNPATLNGSVNHKYFKGYSADITINANDCMVLNTRPKDNNLFYGTAFATGVTTIKSIPGSLSFDISAKTGKNTKFFIPLNSSETISEYSFITFINPDSTNHQSKPVETNIPLNTAKTGMDLNFDLEATPDAEVQLIFDLKGGDVMKGHGSGDLNISLNKKGEFKISGDYVIEDGDYLFTLGNMLNKSFSVENGGKISFNGDIKNAEIDMKAIYKLKASLFEILQDERFNERIPVECQINLSGKLFNPVVNLDIYLPLADEATRTYLKNVITTEEELSRQFLYLLVMNSFYADPSYGTSHTNTTSTGTSAMAVTTTEMVSNQLSNWLSQISNDFEIGFTYRPGYKDISSDEVQLALSTQLLNDKVVINGNFDVRGTTSGTTSGTTNNTDQLTGDFDIEYKITEKIRFKVFNRFNNPYTGKQAPYTQGFGLFFRQDFDNFSDLFRKKIKSDMKKDEKPTVQKK